MYTLSPFELLFFTTLWWRTHWHKLQRKPLLDERTHDKIAMINVVVQTYCNVLVKWRSIIQLHWFSALMQQYSLFKYFFSKRECSILEYGSAPTILCCYMCHVLLISCDMFSHVRNICAKTTNYNKLTPMYW